MKLKVNKDELQIEAVHACELKNKNNNRPAIRIELNILRNGEVVDSYFAEKITERIKDMVNE